MTAGFPRPCHFQSPAISSVTLSMAVSIGRGMCCIEASGDAQCTNGASASAPIPAKSIITKRASGVTRPCSIVQRAKKIADVMRAMPPTQAAPLTPRRLSQSMGGDTGAAGAGTADGETGRGV